MSNDPYTNPDRSLPFLPSYGAAHGQNGMLSDTEGSDIQLRQPLVSIKAALNLKPPGSALYPPASQTNAVRTPTGWAGGHSSGAAYAPGQNFAPVGNPTQVRYPSTAPHLETIDPRLLQTRRGTELQYASSVHPSSSHWQIQVPAASSSSTNPRNSRAPSLPAATETNEDLQRCPHCKGNAPSKRFRDGPISELYVCHRCYRYEKEKKKVRRPEVEDQRGKRVEVGAKR
ncbi:hypothetical protein C8F01DRAFT_1084950 [Mycena amicta]|nr:hypothetical protein C8F01DRAFT_1084950 [Mycena amicta]